MAVLFFRQKIPISWVIMWLFTIKDYISLEMEPDDNNMLCLCHHQNYFFISLSIDFTSTKSKDEDVAGSTNHSLASLCWNHS